MTRWAPEKNDTVRALAVEILHNYGRGRAFVGVDGPDAVAAATFADDVASALKDQGHETSRVSISDFVASRAEGSDGVAEAPRDAIAVVDGALLGRPELKGVWNYAIWVEGGDAGDRTPEARGRSMAVIDNTDPEHPRRLFDDAC